MASPHLRPSHARRRPPPCPRARGTPSASTSSRWRASRARDTLFAPTFAKLTHKSALLLVATERARSSRPPLETGDWRARARGPWGNQPEPWFRGPRAAAGLRAAAGQPGREVARRRRPDEAPAGASSTPTETQRSPSLTVGSGAARSRPAPRGRRVSGTFAMTTQEQAKNAALARDLAAAQGADPFVR